MKLENGPDGTPHRHLPKQIQAIADRLNSDDSMLLKSAYFHEPGKVFLAVRAMELSLKNNNWENARKYLVWCKNGASFDQDPALGPEKARITLFPWSAGNPEV